MFHCIIFTDPPCISHPRPILSAATGIRTVDVGAAQWGMHSIRETMGTADIAHTVLPRRLGRRPGPGAGLTNTKGYSSTHLAIGFANVRAGTRALMLVLVQASAENSKKERLLLMESINSMGAEDAEESVVPEPRESQTRVARPAPAPASVLEYPPEHERIP